MDRKNFIKKSACGTASLAAPILGLGAIEMESVSSQNQHEMKRYKCKITVLRREFFADLAEKYLANPNAGKCNIFHDGQEFILEQGDFFSMMKGEFCSEAWDAISRYVYAALQGGSIMRGWTNDEKMIITCCNDGVRPVIFKLERIDE
ncbi:TIGR04076 family protein [Draconibacterium mangrovi]|uniref:TIGR04076 family protein n=1 Tax=Draconibacterium mangrovi TaxID=2697469 RepID=UPI0019549100|nr:TIGR04076 family protein [Draconibacterium mangrovi]